MIRLASSLVAVMIASSLPAQADCRFTLNFAHGSAALSVRDSLLLRDLARTYPDGPMALSAHADDDGTRAQNDRVARARANVVVNRLRRSGLHQGAIDMVLEASADWDVVPTTRNASSPLNRRVELFVGGCDPKNHVEARRVTYAPGVAFRPNGRIRLTSPRLPGG